MHHGRRAMQWMRYDAANADKGGYDRKAGHFFSPIQIIMVMQSLLLNTQDPFKQNMQQWRTIHSQSLIHPFI